MRPKQHETSIIRDIRRKIAGRADLEAAFPWSQIRSQQQRQRGWKLYSFHAPEVECIGKGKASAPYEFGVKASIVTTNARAPGGQFVLHARALPGNPYDGHTLSSVIEARRGSPAARSSEPRSTRDMPSRYFRSSQCCQPSNRPLNGRLLRARTLEANSDHGAAATATTTTTTETRPS